MAAAGGGGGGRGGGGGGGGGGGKDQLQIPLGFARVSAGVFRSAYPARSTLPFISTLKLKSMVCLFPKDIRSDLREYLQQNDIKLLEADVGINQEPFVAMSSRAVSSVLSFVANPCNLPALIFCTNGKVRTGCVVGCIRKMAGWSIISIIHELEQATDADSPLDQSFIENFEIEHS